MDDLNTSMTKASILDIPPVARIPPELLNFIFGHIPSLRDQHAFMLTCRTWCSISIESIWYRPALSLDSIEPFLRTVETPVEKLTMPYGSMVKRLNLIALSSILTDEVLLRAVGCNRLERLTLGGCSQLTDVSLVKMLKSNPKILSVDISHLEQVSDAVLLAMAENCRQLQGLYATSCAKLQDRGLHELAKGCPNLKRIKLSGCLLITDESLQMLVGTCRYLTELDVTNCPAVGNTVVSAAVTSLPLLREVRLAGIGGINDQAFMGLGIHNQLEKLRVVDLASCTSITNTSIHHLVRSAPRLRNFVLTKCVNIGDEGVMALCSLGRNLQHVHLGHCNSITDRSIKALVKACQRIIYMDVACCLQLTNEAIKEIATLPKLRRIGVVKCVNIGDEAIYALAERSKDASTGEFMPHENTLERVHLSYCTKITIPAVTALVNACGKMTHLSLTGVPPFFMQPELTQYCRPPPSDFTQHQQALFCVFSGNGVDQLRMKLNEMFNEHWNSALQGYEPLDMPEFEGAILDDGFASDNE